MCLHARESKSVPVWVMCVTECCACVPKRVSVLEKK